MAGSPKRKARRVRLAKLTADPDTMRVIVEHIAEGGTLVELSREWDVPYNELSAWITAEDTRRDRYNLALDLRKEFLSDIVIGTLRTVADVDIADAYDKKGNMKAMHKIPAHVRRAIAAVEVLEEYEGRGEDRKFVGYTKKLKLVSKEKAVELLGKYRKLFTDKVEHNVSVTLEDLVGGSMTPTARAPASQSPAPAGVDGQSPASDQ